MLSLEQGYIVEYKLSVENLNRICDFDTYFVSQKIQYLYNVNV